MTERQVIGLDLALGGTGIALTDGTTLRYVPIGAKGYERHLAIARKILGLHGLTYVDEVVLEDYAPHSLGINSTIAAGELQGLIRSHLTAQRVPWRAIPPSQLKKYATGSGTASKAAMVEAAIAAGARPDITHDEADAWHLRAYGLDHPPTQDLRRAALSK